MPIQHDLMGAVGRASEGQSVAWIGTSHTRAREDFLSVADVLADGAKVRRTNGAESVEFPNGGRICFISSAGRGGRGLAVDRVYVPADAGHDLMEAVAPMVSTSKDPAIVGYFR